MEYHGAGHLSVEHIGKTITFRTWDAAREIGTIVTAELRQISHNGNETTIVYGLGAAAEYTFEHDHKIAVGVDDWKAISTVDTTDLIETLAPDGEYV